MRKSAHLLLTALLLLLSLLPVGAQTSAIERLRQRRAAALKSIEETNNQLSSTQRSTRSMLNDLKTITAQIESGKKVITLINKEVDAITLQQQRTRREIEELERELTLMKERYAKALQSISLHRAGYDKLMFLLSAESLSQTYRRMRYLHEYTAWRKAQGLEIIEKQEVLDKKLAYLATSRKEQLALLDERTAEATKLQSKESQQRSVVNNLKKRESNLRTELSKQRKEATALDNRIEELIAEEVRKAQERAAAAAAKAKAEGKGSSATKAAVEADVRLSGTFEKNRGKLPVPVTGSYLLVGKYGVHKHPDLKNVEVSSNGIDLQVKPKSEARCVFDGEVTRIFVMAGYNSSVIVRHGAYLTIYSNLEKVYVTVGEKVKGGEKLGCIYTDREENNRTVLHFQLWKERTKQNPAYWLNL